MTLTVITAGLQTSIVAAPFRGARGQAMPAAGATDPLAHAIANAMLGKSAHATALEITLTAAVFRAGCAMHIACAGAAPGLVINGGAHPAYHPVAVAAGDAIAVPAAPSGMRSYLALSCDFDVPLKLGSQTSYLPGGFGGFAGRALRDGDVLPLLPGIAQPNPLPDAVQPHYGPETLLRFTSGPESYGCEQTLAGRWQVSDRMDRMGIALSGPALHLNVEAAMASSAVFPGTIQCPQGGQPFILGVDGQTTGGYPRIGQIIRADRHLIGQLRPRAHVRLLPVSVEQAQAIYRQKLALWRCVIEDLRLD